MYLKKWCQNARNIALAQSVMPALLAVALAWERAGFRWYCALLAVVGVAFAHLAMNLADDYFDYKVDMLGDRDRVIRKGFRAMTVKYPYLVDGSETMKSTAKAIAMFVVIAVCCGVIIFADRLDDSPMWGSQGLWWMPAIVLVCAFLGVFYSAPPLKLAYRGLGEIVIGIIFGPLLMMGVYYASCAEMSAGVVLVSIPVGLLVLNILFTHSFIDMPGDKESNKMTLARLVGSTKANLALSAVFIFVPFVFVVAGVVFKELSPLYLIVLFVLPRGVWLFRSLVEFSRGSVAHMGRPPFWLGPMGDWESYRDKGIDWFLGRWLCSRNLLSGFCLLMGLAAIVVKIFA